MAEFLDGGQPISGTLTIDGGQNPIATPTSEFSQTVPGWSIITPELNAESLLLTPQPPGSLNSPETQSTPPGCGLALLVLGLFGAQLFINRMRKASKSS